MDNTLFKLFIVFLSVYKLLCASVVLAKPAPTMTTEPHSSSGGDKVNNPMSEAEYLRSVIPQPPTYVDPNSLCSQQRSTYSKIQSDLMSKCGGTNIQNCITEAQKCNGNGDDGSDYSSSYSSSMSGNLMNTLQSGVLATLTGGFPMVGANGPDSFKCLPTNRLDQIKNNLKDMKTSAEKAEKDAKEYKRKIEDKANDLNEKISDLKKNFSEKIKDVKKAAAELPLKEKQIREEAETKSEELWDKIQKNEDHIAMLTAGRAEKSTLRSTLYVKTIGKCADDLAADKDAEVQKYFAEVDKMQAALNNPSLTANEQYQIKKKFKAYQIQNRAQLNNVFNTRYNRCIKEQTAAYQAGYQSLTNEIENISREINSKGIENVNLSKKLGKIPETINQGIKALRDQNVADKEDAIGQLQALQQKLTSDVQTYQQQSTQAQSEYQTAEQKLRFAQMQQFSNQSIYQMNTFGDAAPILHVLNEAKADTCVFCTGQYKPKYCSEIGSKAGGNGSL